MVGGGQLGRLFALEARRMGYHTIILDPDSSAPAGQVADDQIRAPLADISAARELAARADVVTLEWENADVGAISALEELIPVRPGAGVLRVAQNRILEKTEARRLGLSTADFRAVSSQAELVDAVRDLGTPSILKTATGGYDGKGQAVIRSPGDAATAFAELGGGVVPLILEAFVDFRMEVSVLCARGPDGRVESFPVVENRHQNGILDLTLAPAPLPAPLAREAVKIGETLTRGLGVVGLLAVEMVVGRDDQLYVNEIAPRPHNSGHYTWEACSVSQFEQQLRAVCGLPLARPELLRPAAMANLLGEHCGTGKGLLSVADALARPGLALHLYGKQSARAGRKMGHLTALADSAEEAATQVMEARAAIEAEYRRNPEPAAGNRGIE
jgi:5-(carboxyamino)imidazole ribonucleotide synthase